MALFAQPVDLQSSLYEVNGFLVVTLGCVMAGQASHRQEGGGRSLIVNPDGRILQKAGERETILTEIIDLDDVTKSREYGSLGLCQLWKQLRDYPQDFPIYKNGIATGPIYENLGRLGFHRTLEIDHEK
jgi:hypothetical protein